MTRFLLLLFGLTIFIACSSDDSDCGTYNGKQVHEGPEGGCYYINSSGNKEYVNRSYCNC